MAGFAGFTWKAYSAFAGHVTGFRGVKFVGHHSPAPAFICGGFGVPDDGVQDRCCASEVFGQRLPGVLADAAR